jgi:UDP-glucose 4-epimerase
VLVTGAGGYIGGRLVGTLLDAGWTVRGLVRDPAPRLHIEQIVCDLAGDVGDDLARACDGVDTIVHLAGEDEVVCARDPAAALASTVIATERVAEAAARAGVRRLVYMSTVHVYGDRMTPGAMLTESLRPEPRSAYAISRLASEHIAAGLASDGGYELVILRLTNSVGAPDDPAVDRWTLVANDLSRQGASSGRLELHSAGVQWRDFVPLRDVCSAIAAASRVADPLVAAGTYNFGSGEPRTVRALAGMIQDAFERETGTRPELHAPDPGPDPPEPYFVSVDRAAQHGLGASGSLDEAVAETVRFCLSHTVELA